MLVIRMMYSNSTTLILEDRNIRSIWTSLTASCVVEDFLVSMLRTVAAEKEETVFGHDFAYVNDKQ